MMGTFEIPPAELLVAFQEFLQSFEGNVSAHTVAVCWNDLAEQFGWGDYLIATYDKRKAEPKDPADHLST